MTFRSTFGESVPDLSILERLPGPSQVGRRRGMEGPHECWVHCVLVPCGQAWEFEKFDDVIFRLCNQHILIQHQLPVGWKRTMAIPETPADTGYFEPQAGYVDVNFKTHTYSDKPTPFSAKQGRALEFISSHTDREHQKKYGKQIFTFLINFICK